MAFPPLGNSDHVVFSDYVEFLSNSKRDAPFHHITYDYSSTDWSGLYDNLRGVPLEDILNLVLLLLLVHYVSGSRLEVMYISLIVNFRSSLTHLHDFYLFVLLP